MRWRVAAGLALLASGALASWLHVGERDVAFYLPDIPIVQSLLDARTTQQPQSEQLSTEFRLKIPDIGVDAPVDQLGLNSQGQVESPSKWQDTGWYDGSSPPGDPGVALVLGHVDSHTGPAVFYRLHELTPGAPVLVEQGGRELRFSVASVASYPETALPDDRLFVAGGERRLALLTCSGDFNRATGRYDDRLIVFADPSA
jgi:sortase (surface protein transpeptidase)